MACRTYLDTNPHVSKFSEVTSSPSPMLFDDVPNVLDDMKIDSFTVDGEPIPFSCATSSVILPEEFMMQQSDTEEEVIEIQNTRGGNTSRG